VAQARFEELNLSGAEHTGLFAMCYVGLLWKNDALHDPIAHVPLASMMLA
jgi:hypothetical protein